MVLQAHQVTLLLLCYLVLVCASSVSLEDVRPGMMHRSIKKLKGRDGLKFRKGQKEVVENYEIGSNGHLMQQLAPLKAFLTEKLRDYESHKEKGPIWTEQKVIAKASVPNRLIEHRRKREIVSGDVLKPNSLKVTQTTVTNLDPKEHKLNKREEDYVSDSESILEIGKVIKGDKEDKLVKDKSLFKDKEDYDNFFRNEYYRTLAQSFATSRKKRETYDANNEFYELTGRLDSIEDALLSDVMDSVTNNKGNRNAIETMEMANDVDNVRTALTHLKEMLDKIDENDLKSGNLDLSETISLKDQPQKVGTLPVVFRTHGNAKTKTWGDLTDEVPHVQHQNAGFRPLPGFSARPIPDSDLPLGKWKFFDEDRKEQECPTLFLLTRDCSSLGNIIPEAKLRNVLIRACNWLEICYACGQGYELQPDDCDTGFLYGIRSVCEGDVPCQANGRLLLLSLRQTGASRKSLQPMCNADRCVERFLRQPSP